MMCIHIFLQLLFIIFIINFSNLDLNVEDEEIYADLLTEETVNSGKI